jgi:mono/diheme cytochrome c family protein
MKPMDLMLLPLAALLGGGCDGKWPASMEQQPTVDPVAAPRPAPEGSIPVGGIESFESRDEAQDLTNPRAGDATSVVAGARLFQIHCVVCHGHAGRGDGKVSKKFPPAPDLRYRTICRRSDGFIYGTITAGGRAMPSLREGLTSRDRWALVSFVRGLQKSGCTDPAGGVAPGSEGAGVP